MQLTRKDEKPTWLPTSIEKLDDFLGCAINDCPKYPNARGLRRNIAYSLQYIEYLEQTLSDLRLTSVIITQTWKNIIIVGCGIVESLLHYFLVSSGSQATTLWESTLIATGNPKTTNGTELRIDSHVYTKLAEPKNQQMSFDAMLKRAEKRCAMGNDHAVYAKMNLLRSLRNRVHLHEMRSPYDTDWNAFNSNEHMLMIRALYTIFTSKPFAPTSEQVAYFAYMGRFVTP